MFLYLVTGATGIFRSKKAIYIALFAICFLFSLFVSIPATIKAAIFLDDPPGNGIMEYYCMFVDFILVLANEQNKA